MLGVGDKKLFCIRARTSYIHLEFIRYRIDGVDMEEFLDCYKLKLWYWYVLVKDRVVVLFQMTAIVKLQVQGLVEDTFKGTAER